MDREDRVRCALCRGEHARGRGERIDAMRLLSRWLLLAMVILAAAVTARSLRALAAFPTITIPSGPVAPGGTAFVSGANFKGNESVTIYLQGVRVQSGLVSPAGTFSLSFVVPLTTPPGY